MSTGHVRLGNTVSGLAVAGVADHGDVDVAVDVTGLGTGIGTCTVAAVTVSTGGVCSTGSGGYWWFAVTIGTTRDASDAPLGIRSCIVGVWRVTVDVAGSAKDATFSDSGKGTGEGDVK